AVLAVIVMMAATIVTVSTAATATVAAHTSCVLILSHADFFFTSFSFIGTTFLSLQELLFDPSFDFILALVYIVLQGIGHVQRDRCKYVTWLWPPCQRFLSRILPGWIRSRGRPGPPASAAG